MRIDLPCCDFKNCKYQFDGNCMDKDKYEKCEYIKLVLNDLPTVQKWIPVNERLPETDESVLATDGINMFVAWYYEDWQEWESYGFFGRDTPIIAWMPLPQLYKKEREENDDYNKL